MKRTLRLLTTACLVYISPTCFSQSIQAERSSGGLLLEAPATNPGLVQLQESDDLLHWIDSSPLTTGGNPLDVPAWLTHPRRYYRTASLSPLAPPAPLPSNDIFQPFLTRVPEISTVLSEETRDNIVIRRFRFTSFEGTSDGGLSPNEIYAVLARPVGVPASPLPAVLVCHGGNGSAEELKAITWAKLGFIALAPEFPGYASIPNLQSISRVTNVNATPWVATPNARASTYFDTIVAGMGAFNYLAAEPGVDTNRICILGASMGGYMTSLLGGLFDVRVHRTFSLYGCGFINDTVFAYYLFPLPETEKQSWLAALDPSVRLSRFRATHLLYAACDDTFFPPPAIMETFNAVPSDKYICFAPNDDHNFRLPGGAVDFGSASWTYMESVYFLNGVNVNQPVLPKLTCEPAQGRTVRLNVAGTPPGLEAWAYYSTNYDAASWHTREWKKVTAREDHGAYVITFPEAVSTSDWFAGASFQFSSGLVTMPMSLSTPMYHEVFSD